MRTDALKRRDSDSFERMQMFPKCPETRRRDSDSDSDDDELKTRKQSTGDAEQVMRPSIDTNERHPNGRAKPRSFVYQHKTTLGEAEIKSAVEAAAVVFKKVVLQRREAAHKKQQRDEG